MDKQNYHDMWVYVEHDGNSVQPVSLELCCEIRKLADTAGEKLCAVIVGDLAKAELARVLDCGADKLLIVRGEGWTPFTTRTSLTLPFSSITKSTSTRPWMPSRTAWAGYFRYW